MGTIIFEYSNLKPNFLVSCCISLGILICEQVGKIYLHRHSQKVNLKFISLKIFTLIATLFLFELRAKLGSADWQNFSVPFQRQLNKPDRDPITIFTWNYFMLVKIVRY